jgi:1-pyrroline-5-carboxylate dehydrogenase
MSWHHRASIFMKAASLISGKYRALINASTMLGQSKTVYQAEIDSACELIDFLRFNVFYMQSIYEEQIISDNNTWNRMEYRPLEGFVYAVTPFNFTAIGGNLPIAPAMLGNVVVWKPASNAIYSNYIIMKILKEAGLPDGVINFIPGESEMISDILVSDKNFSALHFTGSTKVFNNLYKKIGNNIEKYKSYPRIVGETGGKDFIFAHETAPIEELSVAMIRGAFEYQGQKCSAASRCFIPKAIWAELEKSLLSKLNLIKVGDVEQFDSFMGALIDEKAFNKVVKYIEDGLIEEGTNLIFGGTYNNSKGFFVQPTIFTVENEKSPLLLEEIFGPVLSIYLYDDIEKAIQLCDESTVYALTGAIFSSDRLMIEYLEKKLINSAGNFYINDKPTGAVVGAQPFGGGRGSGTNDKAGSKLNLYRFLNSRVIKENLSPPECFKYPYME